MRVPLDENLPIRLRRFLPGHDVVTVDFLGWKGTRNGELLTRAVTEGFQAIVTMDRAIVEQQQRSGGVPLCIVVLVAPSNALEDLLPLLPRLHRALSTATAGAAVRVGD